MAKQGETKFKEKVWKKLKPLAPDIYAEKITQRSKRGFPDFVICAGGIYVVWELKLEYNEADPLQGYVLDKIESAGGIRRVVKPSNLDEAIEELKQIAAIGRKYEKAKFMGKVFRAV